MKQVSTAGLTFADLREYNKCYVDKTLLIKDLIDSDDRIHLFTRPRRFGKTTNLSMLDAFFNMEYKGNAWFDGLAISEHEEYESYKNAFPVINLDMKDVNAPDYDRFLADMGAVILEAFKEHAYLLDSPVIMEDERILFDSLSRGTVDRTMLRFSIKKLSALLHRHHGRKVVVLIDEYDCAVSDSFGEASHRPMMDFLGDFMKATIKGNKSLQMAYVTGIMQIAKESILSDLNNIEVNTVFSTDSDERFGFTEEEVKGILSYYGHPERFEEAKNWYDGYRFGRVDVYNPYSIMKFVSNHFEIDTYWVNTGGDYLIRWLLERISDENFARILGLIEGKAVDVQIVRALPYSQVRSNEMSLYSLMVMAGYLKAVPQDGSTYRVSIPNTEVAGVISKLVSGLYPINTALFDEFNRAVLDHDADRMASLFQKILLGGSYLNLSNENSYELILMTVMYGLAGRYAVRTEYEAGNGRTDIILSPKHEGTVPLIIELKRVRSDEELDEGLDDAIRQIHRMRYYSGMPGKVILIGMSIHVKTPKVRTQVIDNGPDGLSYVPTDSDMGLVEDSSS